MTPCEARQIIESLADGFCPVTGQKLGGAYQQPDVVRALFAAARALEQVERIERRKRFLPCRAGSAWDAAEDQQLLAEFHSGKNVAEIAQIHQRSRGAIKSRLERLGKLVPASL